MKIQQSLRKTVRVLNNLRRTVVSVRFTEKAVAFLKISRLSSSMCTRRRSVCSSSTFRCRQSFARSLAFIDLVLLHLVLKGRFRQIDFFSHWTNASVALPARVDVFPWTPPGAFARLRLVSAKLGQGQAFFGLAGPVKAPPRSLAPKSCPEIRGITR